jgi:hypothetical protein
VAHQKDITPASDCGFLFSIIATEAVDTVRGMQFSKSPVREIKPGKMKLDKRNIKMLS